MESLAQYLDAAVLAPHLTPAEAETQIRTAIEHHCKTVCVRPCDLGLATHLCKGKITQPSVVLGFPHGDQSTQTKLAEARDTMRHAPLEVDMVGNIGWIRGGQWDLYIEEIRGILEIVRAGGALLKVIFETSQLHIAQIEEATRACASVGVDFVKTSTGFTGEGATVEAVQAMLNAGEGCVQVKASGGIRDAEKARMFLAMGCTRLGVGVSSVPALLTEGVTSGQGY